MKNRQLLSKTPRGGGRKRPITLCNAATAAALCALTLMSSCAPRKVVLDFNNVPDNERCQYMKDVCREAERFQGEFEQMTKEEKDDARQILGAYIQQCEGARELCLKTME